MGGRKPTPAALIDPVDHKKSASEIAERQRAEDMLQTNAALRCPRKLSPLAKKEWRRIMKLYRRMSAQILNDLDRQSLIMYCEAVAAYEVARQLCAREQENADDPDVLKVIEKCLAVMDKQAVIISRLSEQLCLTPVGRARMGMAAVMLPKEPNALEKFLTADDDEDDDE